MDCTKIPKIMNYLNVQNMINAKLQRITIYFEHIPIY